MDYHAPVRQPKRKKRKPVDRIVLKALRTIEMEVRMPKFVHLNVVKALEAVRQDARQQALIEAMAAIAEAGGDPEPIRAIHAGGKTNEG